MRMPTSDDDRVRQTPQAWVLRWATEASLRGRAAVSNAVAKAEALVLDTKKGGMITRCQPFLRAEWVHKAVGVSEVLPKRKKNIPEKT